VCDTADVVDQQNVDLDDAEPLLAVLEGTQNAVVRVVEDGLKRQRVLPPFAAVVRRGARHEVPAGFGGQHILVTRIAAQCIAQTMLGFRMAVVRRRVEKADACLHGGGHRGQRLFVGQIAVQAAERCGAQAESRDLQPAPADRAALRDF